MATLADRIAEVLGSGRISARAWARAAGRSDTWLNTFLSRKGHHTPRPGKRTRGAPDIKATDALKLARAISVSVEWLMGGEEPPLEERWIDFKAWVQETPALRDVVDAHPRDLTVGDLLRYRAAPSSAGQRDAGHVWSLMQTLRGGLDVTNARPVTEAEEARAMRPRRPTRRT